MLILKASAGSGKTYNLAMQFILRLVVEGDEAFRHILAVTFTKDATAEMKLRILADLYSIANGNNQPLIDNIKRELPDRRSITDEQIKAVAGRALLKILHDYGNFNVGTIDSFFQRVLRNLARELGKGSRFNIDLNDIKAVAEAVREVIAQAHNDTVLLDWLESFVNDKISEEKTWNVERELRIFGLNIFNEVYQTQQHNIIRLLEENPDIFKEKITEYKKIINHFESYLKRKADEFFTLSAEYGIVAETFNRKTVFNHFKKFVDKYFDFEAGKMILDALEDYGSLVTKSNPERNTLLPVMERVFHPLLKETEEFRERYMARYLAAKLCLKNIFNLGLLSYISKEIDRQSRENNRFMLKDTAMVLNAMINPEHDFSFVYEKIGADVRNVMIDEFQDTSWLQWQNFKALLADITASGRFSLLVGDVKQSIYRWRNGDWRILNNIEDEIRHAETRVLDTNWRSARNIVEFNNDVFGKMAQMLPEKFRSTYGSLPYNPFEKAYGDVRQHAAKTADEGFVSVGIYDRDDEALDMLGKTLDTLARKGYPAEKICVLCRTNKEVRQVADFLAKSEPEDDAYKNVVSDEAFLLSSSPAVQLIVAVMQVIDNPQDKVAAYEVGFIGKTLGLPSVDWRAELSDYGLKSLYETAMTIISLSGIHRIEGQAGYLYAFMDYLMSYQQDNSADISDFVRYWSDELSRKTVGSSSIKGIRVMTIHKSKGLEFDTVIIPFLEEDMHRTNTSSIVWCGAKDKPFDLPVFPIEYDKRMERSVFRDDFIDETIMLLMDSLNVFYVACTRAVNNLFIFAKRASGETKKIRIEQLLQESVTLDDDTFASGNLSDYNASAGSSSVPDDNPFKNLYSETVRAGFDIQNGTLDKTLFIQSNSSREFILGQDGETSPFVLEGNIMHSIFSAIDTADDVDSAVRNLVYKGIITDSDSRYYVSAVSEAIANPLVAEWYSGQYKTLNEQTIISKTADNRPAASRPDRVMIDGRRAIVVDYKFGQPQAAHRRQIVHYMSLLEKMGYSVEGYLWYVKANNIERVLL